MEPDTNSYKSPYYADLAAEASRRYDLPDGLLSAIVTRGERSNADQVSSAQARTVFQIIPATRDAALKKYGVDAYLSPANAADVSARLLRESLDRNKGSAPLAVAEYHGGTDPDNWGPVTRAYVQRVTGTPLAPASSPDVKQSTYDRLQAAKVAASTPSIANVVKAYQSGTMDPESRAEFEADVAAGKVLLPRGVTISAPKAAPPAPAAEAQGGMIAPPGVIEAYQAGKMTPEERHEFEGDVAEGRITVPQGVEVAAPKGIVGNVIEGAKAPLGAAEAALTMATGTVGAVAGAVKGLAKNTAAGNYGKDLKVADEEAQRVQEAMTYQPRTDAGKGFVQLAGKVAEPFAALGPAAITGDVAQIASLAKPAAAQAVQTIRQRLPQAAARGVEPSAILGADGKPLAPSTPAAPPPAAPEVIPGSTTPAAPIAPDLTVPAVPEGASPHFATGDYPPAKFSASGLAVREDVPNMDSIKSSLDNYEVLPGVREVPLHDLVEPGSKPTYYSVAERDRTKALAREIANNGEINPLIIGINDKGPYVIEGGHRLDALHELGKDSFPAIIVKDLDTAAVKPPAPEVIPPDSTPAAPIAPELTAPDAAPTMTAEQIAATTRKASTGFVGRERAMQELASEAAPDARRTQAMEELGFEYQPDHVTTSQVYRELVQVIKSIPGSETGAAELRMLKNNAQKADELITQLGGTKDASVVDAKVRAELNSIHAKAKADARGAFKEIEDRIDPVTPTPATDTIALLNERARRLGGADKLSAGESSLLADLTAEGKPTYAFIDGERKALNEAKYNNQSKFGSTDARAREQLIEALRADQGRIVETLGAGDAWARANAATQLYKGIEADLKRLFGKELSGSIVGKLRNAVADLPKGDVSRFISLVKTVPENIRKEVVASGLSNAFGQSVVTDGINFAQYAKWFEGLQRNTLARDALFANLPPEAVKSLTNLYHAAKGISMATREGITTGRLETGVKVIEQNLLKGDSLLSRVFDFAKKAGAAEVVGATVGLPPGVSTAIAAALTKGRTSAMRAADALINSPEFIAAARKASQQNIARLARSKSFTRFMRESKGPKGDKERERWIVTALQAKGKEKK